MNEWKQKARSMIARAALAPSSHNTQPWFFRVTESAINLYADRTRALPVNDPENRELTISCGCALMNLRLAAASDGVGVRVELLPEPGEPDLLARVSICAKSSALAEDAELAEYIESRHTYRRRFASREVGESTLNRLLEGARREGACLLPLAAEDARQQAADLVTEGDAAQWADPGWRRELAAWMHPRRQGDGLTIPAAGVAVAQLVVRTFDMGGRVGAKDRQLAEASPLLAVLSTDGDLPCDWLQAGQALQRVLLIGCRYGLQASYLNQPIQVASLRSRLRDIAGPGFAQILLRIGYPRDEISPAPRRALEDVID